MRIKLGTPNWHGKHTIHVPSHRPTHLSCFAWMLTIRLCLTINFYKFTNCVPLNYVIYLYPYIYSFVDISRKIVLKKKYNIYRIKMGFLY